MSNEYNSIMNRPITIGRLAYPSGEQIINFLAGTLTMLANESSLITQKHEVFERLVEVTANRRYLKKKVYEDLMKNEDLVTQVKKKVPEKQTIEEIIEGCDNNVPTEE
jgi:hypothetical protein